MEKLLSKARGYIIVSDLKRTSIHFVIAFLMGRVFLADCISPFGLSYLCSYMKTEKKSVFKITMSAILSALGTATVQSGKYVLKNLLSYVLFALIIVSFSAFANRKGKFSVNIIAACACAISGIIYYAQTDNFIRNLIMLAAECTICFFLPIILSSSVKIISDDRPLTEITYEDIIGIYTLSALSITGFCGLYIGSISVCRVISGLFIMVVSYSGGFSHAVTCGVTAGILYSLYSFEFNEYAGILGFCGLLTGAVKRFKRPGIILGFTISAKLLSAYFGGWSDSIFSDYEIILAVCLFCIIPYSALYEISGIINAGTYNNPEIASHINRINTKIRNISASFESLAEVLRNVFCNVPPNITDNATIYEIASDKICKNCGLKFICWEKDSFDTCDSLNKAVGILMENGHLKSSDIPENFKKKCIKLSAFVNELNRVFCKYKLSTQWQSKINQSQKLISMQLDGVSDIVGNIADDVSKDIIFDRSNENKIYYMLEQKGFRCTDVTVAKSAGKICNANIRISQKRTNCTELCTFAEEIVSEVLNTPMTVEHFNCRNNKYILTLCERECYKVDCSYICTPKKGEKICGDSLYHGRLSGGKYAVILSDGMGCGESASRQSLAATELMQQFLNAGFNKDTAAGMVSSALMINSSESFATLDVAIIDLFSANIEFIKAGANTTYIKRKDSVQKIVSSSLPVGIIDCTSSDTYSYQASDKDMIIMLSDGIHNAIDSWCEDYIMNIHEDNPEIIAQLLTNEAAKNKKQEDDMTVAVIKISKQ